MSDPRENIAKDPNTPLSTLAEFLDSIKDVRMALASNPKLPITIMEKLAEDFDDEVRSSLAKNPATTADILKDLSKNKSRDINESLAQNPSSPIPILEELFDNSIMHEFLAGNISLPNNLLEDLIHSKSYTKLAKSTLKRKLENDSKKALLDKYNTKDENRSGDLKKLEEAIASKKLKLFKDAIKEFSTESKVEKSDYNMLAIMATTLSATPILKHIFKSITPEEDLLSDCFLVAAANNKINLLKYLLDQGANINSARESGVNALIISIQDNKPKAVDFLLASGIDINLSDNNGDAALHHALRERKIGTIEKLIDKGADLNIENGDGLVPLALAWNLELTPAIIDLIVSANSTNMRGEAGQKIMNEALKHKGNGRIEQRHTMKNLYFSNQISKLSKEEFVEKHGEIGLMHSDAQGLRTPNRDSNEIIMKGQFTSVGYFPRDLGYMDIKHHWESLDYAIDLSGRLAKVLNGAGCVAPNTEASADYEPFFIPYAGWKDLIDFDSTPSDEALKESRGAYNKNISSEYNTHVFFDDIEEHYSDGFINKEQYKAFKEASELMKMELEQISSIQFYPDFVQFPWLFAGLDKYRSLVGVITSAVWT